MFTCSADASPISHKLPGAHLIYQVRKHEVSVFIFQDRGEETASLPSGPVHAQSFTVENWTQNGLRYFVIGDVGAEDIRGAEQTSCECIIDISPAE